MEEGNVYLCNHKERDGEYLLELQAHTSIVSQGDSLQDCMDDICDQIIQWNGDGEAILEVVSIDEVKGGHGSYKVIKYGDSTSSTNSIADLYTGGACKKCSHPVGERNDISLELTEKPKKAVIGVWCPLPLISIFSDKFIDALPSEVLDRVRVLSVKYKGKDSGYKELVVPFSAKMTGVVGASYPSALQQNWLCSECGRSTFSVAARDYGLGVTFVNSEELPSFLPQFMAVDAGSRPDYVIHGELWKKLLGNRNLKGLCSDPMVILSPDKVEMPELILLDEFEW